jgi:hypothetical protein
MKLILLALSVTILLAPLKGAAADSAPFAHKAPVIDGNGNDAAWAKANWKSLSHLMAGSMPKTEDFSGRYKVSWDKHRLYILAEITDDILFDQYADPKYRYWDDDALEIFVDEDMSGGNHQFNHSAFAYHVALDGQAPDIAGPNHADGSMNVVLLNDHIESNWKRSEDTPNTVIWEVSLSLYDKNFKNDKNDKPVTLFSGKKIGFMLAYCDNDGSASREHFMGSHAIEPVNGDKNRGYIDASVFGQLELVE